MKPLRATIYLIFLLLLASCHPKQVAVSDVDDIYYREVAHSSKKDKKDKKDTKSKSKSKSKPKSKSGTKPKSKPSPLPASPKKAEPRQHLTGDTRALLDEAYTWIGTPYTYGGHSRTGTDCSGFVMEVYRRALNFSLPRSTSEQSEACAEVAFHDLRPGDLIFFHNGRSDTINHVGIYVGNGKFIHASSSQGVMESYLSEKYFSDRYHHAARP